jgi:predicted O-methyltransferase YrrM
MNNLEAEIQTLESFSKQGESYSDGKNRFGWRNPIRQDTGNVLRVLAMSSKARRILEIGTGHGLSTLYLAAGLPSDRNWVFDTIELDAAVAASTQKRMDTLQLPVRVWQGDAGDVIPQLSGPYDLVFFDAQKSHYYDQLQSLLSTGAISAGTVILADNVVDRQTECQLFLDWFDKQGIHHYILQTECGLLVAGL